MSYRLLLLAIAAALYQSTIGQASSSSSVSLSPAPRQSNVDNALGYLAPLSGPGNYGAQIVAPPPPLSDKFGGLPSPQPQSAPVVGTPGQNYTPTSLAPPPLSDKFPLQPVPPPVTLPPPPPPPPPVAAYIPPPYNPAISQSAAQIAALAAAATTPAGIIPAATVAAMNQAQLLAQSSTDQFQYAYDPLGAPINTGVAGWFYRADGTPYPTLISSLGPADYAAINPNAVLIRVLKGTPRPLF
jgi:hypothetical protein